MWQIRAKMADIDLKIQQRYVFDVRSNRIETRKSRRSVACNLIKKSVVVKRTNLHACAHARSQKDGLITMAGEAGIIIGLPRPGRVGDRVDSRVNNRFKYRGTVDRSRYECVHARAERWAPKKKETEN